MLIKFLKVAAVLQFFTATGITLPTDNVVIQWDKTALQLIRETHPAPTVAARALAMAHTCMYDAWAAYDRVAVGTRLDKKFRRPVSESTATNKKKAISYAAYRCLLDVFPRERKALDAAMRRLGYDPDDESADLTSPEGIGNAAAKVIIEVCHGDGSNQLGDLEPGPYEDYTSYSPVNGPDRVNDPDHRQPLRVIDHGDLMIQRFVTPFWNRVASFSLTSPDQFRPGPRTPTTEIDS
jgi:hypothetical protein